MPSETTVQFIAILVTVAGLLGWMVQTIIKYFINTSNSATLYIEKLVSLNQENTTNFVNTINHQRTLDREMQVKHTEALGKLTSEISVSNSINRELMTFLKGNARANQ